MEKVKKITLAFVGATALTAVAPANAISIFFGEDTPNLNPAGETIPTFPTGGNAETARDNFLSSLIGVGNQDFEGFTVGDTPPLKLIFPGSSGDITACLSCTGIGAIQSGYSVGRWPTSGTQYFEESSDSFGLNFGGNATAPEVTPISAFGFYGTDIGDFAGQLTVTLTDILDNETTYTIPHTTNQGNFDNSLLFWGFVDPSNLYKLITFGATQGGVDFFGFDDMVVGDAGQIVPAPGIAALLGIGLAAMGFGQRFRAHS